MKTCYTCTHGDFMSRFDMHGFCMWQPTQVPDTYKRVELGRISATNEGCEVHNERKYELVSMEEVMMAAAQ